jgi:mannose-6-phosphate isomerase-like protein (cupin superfamily)
VTAFGVNAIVLPPGTEWFNHFHHRQDELYFVHAGTAGFEVDGEMVDPADVERRRRFSDGDLDVIRRR